MQKIWLTIFLFGVFICCCSAKILQRGYLKGNEYLIEVGKSNILNKQIFSILLENDTVVKPNSIIINGKTSETNKLNGFVSGISNLGDTQPNYLFLAFKYIDINLMNDSISISDVDQTSYIVYLPEKKNFYKGKLNKTIPPSYSIIESSTLAIVCKKIPSNYRKAFVLSLFPNETINYKYFYYENMEGKNFFFNAKGLMFESLNLLLESSFGSIENYIQLYKDCVISPHCADF